MLLVGLGWRRVVELFLIMHHHNAAQTSIVSLQKQQQQAGNNRCQRHNNTNARSGSLPVFNHDTTSIHSDFFSQTKRSSQRAPWQQRRVSVCVCVCMCVSPGLPRLGSQKRRHHHKSSTPLLDLSGLQHADTLQFREHGAQAQCRCAVVAAGVGVGVVVVVVVVVGTCRTSHDDGRTQVVPFVVGPLRRWSSVLFLRF